jgi:8-amino-7-oxononanoate synthase
MARLDRFETELDGLREKGQLRSLREVNRRGRLSLLDGREMIDLSSNDYLGLARDDDFLRRSYEEAVGEPSPPSFASGASRLLTGNHREYTLLENLLSELYGRAACVFSSGYHANLGICPAIAGRRDAFFSDRLNHASLIDGMRLSGAEMIRYRHLDYDHLETLLAERRPSFRDCFIVTESVFSMDGDVADLDRLIFLRDRYDAMLIVDEAHAVGVFGDNGLGVSELQGVTSEVDIIVGTFGKALSSFGAYAVLNGTMKDYLVNRMRPLIFTTALPPAVVRWSRQTVSTMTAMGAARRRLAELADTLRRRLAEAGLATGGKSQIVPVIAGANETAAALAARLQEEGFLAFPIRPPTVPPGTARLRLSLTANLAWNDIDRLPGIIEEALHEDAVDQAGR